jgi:alkanesulfonate monooxygenase SsuD/methylene tetrahydromethanopterin reductase-like flavin-dependent oxidoreductase (luciferase family)
MALSILRFDMRIPPIAHTPPHALYGAALEMAAWADAKGFDTITLSEHHCTDDGFLASPIAMAGCMIGRTRRIRIGIVALLLPLYDPIKLAEDMLVLDLASGGRFGITAGIGYRPEEFAMFGVDWDRRGAIMDECLQALLDAWNGEPFEYQGRTGFLAPKPVTGPKPPVFVGGMGRNAARRAARFGLPFQPAVNTPEILELYVSEAKRRGVENPVVLPPGDGVMLWVSEDPDRTWSQIGPHLLHEAVTYASWQRPGFHSAVVSAATTIEELRAEGKYQVLTPARCLQRAEEKGPLATFVHFPLCGGIPPEVAWPSLELYADRVLPHLGPAVP